jgi:hypothetical protein
MLGQNRVFWYDYFSDYRNKGQTLSYKVVADDSAYKFGKCGSINRYESISIGDINGDGKLDFIPNSEYAKYFGRHYGWLIPIISLL